MLSLMAKFHSVLWLSNISLFILYTIYYVLYYLHIYEVFQKVSIHVIWKIETFIEEDTRNIVHKTVTPQSPSKEAPWDLTQFSQSSQLPCHIFLNLTDSLKSLLFQRWFSFWEKPEVAGHQVWAVVGLSHLHDLMFHKKTLHKMWCMSGHVVLMKLLITSFP